MRGSGFARLENSPAVENEFEAVQAAGAYAPLTLPREHAKAPTLRPNVRAKTRPEADAAWPRKDNLQRWPGAAKWWLP